MNIEEIDKWLKDQYGISYTEMSNEFNSASEMLSKKIKEIEKLNSIIKPQKNNYDYLKLLFENKSKEEVVKAYTYKCEQLNNVYNSYNKKEIELRKKNNIINDLKKDLEDRYYGRGKYHMDSNVIGIIEVLSKIKELKGSDKE